MRSCRSGGGWRGADGGMACGGFSRPIWTYPAKPPAPPPGHGAQRRVRLRGVSELPPPAPSGSQGVVWQRTAFTTQRESQ